MRCLVAILLILLLPLRSWASDSMAMQMALSGGMPHAMASQGDGHHGAMAPDGHDQPLHAALVGDCADHSADDTISLDDDCPTCTMCQACHNIAIALPVSVLPATEPMHPLPLLAVRHFASADRAPGLKPPIS